MSLTQVKTDSANAAEAVYEALRREIIDGEFAPGTALVEAATAERFGVSRTPTREALRALQRDGLVQYDGRRLVVRITTLEEIIEIYDCRMALEPVASGWAARSRTESDLALLDVALEGMRDIAPSSKAHLLKNANAAFLRHLWRASRNATMFDLLDRLWLHLGSYPLSTFTLPGRWAEAIQEREDLLRAVRERDDKSAAALTREHLEAARSLRLKMVSSQFQGKS